MDKRMRIAFGSIAAIALIAAGTIGIGRALFERRVNEEMATLLAASAVAEPHIVSEDDLSGLPEPVRRWLRWAQVVGKPYPATIRLTQKGRFRQAAGGVWMPFTAEEVFTTEPPAFLWKTTMQMFPLVSIVGRDRYIGGQGSIQMRLLGVVPVADAAGPAMDQGALLRYLNETMWFPAAVLSPSIAWESIDANSARATIRHGDVTGAATFVFDDQGRPVDMIAQRQNLARGQLETWSTPLNAYGEFESVRIPVAGQGIWRYDTGDFSYIELRITGVAYNPQTE